ncbi:hypothetical protein [Neotabrizicola sp. VNH66]|uniref:hypothetical protein n=1 Tax=Neotabrizicola sp. VNH66 TaxID=3400918 RepID=UPI003C0AB059
MAKTDVPGTRIRGKRRMYEFNLRIPKPLQAEFYGGSDWYRAAMHTDSRVEAGNLVTKKKAEFLLQLEELERRATLAAAFETLPPDQRAIFDEAGDVTRLRTQHDRHDTARAFLIAGGGITDADTTIAAVKTDTRRNVPAHEQDELIPAPSTITARAVSRATYKAELAEFDAQHVREAKTLRALGQKVKDPESFGLRELIEKLEGLNHVKAGAVLRWKMVADRFIDFAGDLPLSELSMDHLREFVFAYRQLPARQNTKELRDLSFMDKIKVGRAKNLPPVDEVTITQHVGALRALIPLAISLGYIATDPWARFTLISPQKRNSEAKRKSRLPFTRDMAEATLNDAAGRAAGSVDRWGPLLAAYMGCRQGEICQLLGANVFQVGDTWCLQVTDEDARQSTKNQSSERVIPIHQTVLDAGFIEYASTRAKDEYLFENETAKGLQPMTPDKRGYVSIQFSGRFNKRLRKNLGITDSRYTFHSFRHLWEDCATAVGIDLIHNLEIAGRSKAELGSKALYGSGPRMKALKRSMDKIDPLIDLDSYVQNDGED